MGPMPSPSEALKSETGFTLVELMIAMTVLSIAMIGLLTAFMSVGPLSDVMWDDTVIFNALRGRLESIRSYNYADIMTNFDGTTFDIPDVEPVAAGTPVGSTEVTAPDPPNDPARMIEVRVTAHWKAITGPRTESIALRMVP